MSRKHSNCSRSKAVRKPTFEALERRQMMAANSTLAFLQRPVLDGTPTSALSQAYVDLNGDGILDQVRASGVGPDSTVVRIGNGIGGFGTPTFSAGGGNTVDIEVADANGDGIKDVLFANAPSASPTVDVMLNGLNGTLNRVLSMSLGNNIYPADLAVADINRDNMPDLLVAAYEENPRHGKILTMLGNGQLNTFQAPTTYIPSNTTNFTGPAGIDTGDFNGDGWADMIVTHFWTPGYQIYLNDQSGGFNRQPINFQPNFPGRIEVADFNFDGLDDFVYTCTTNAAYGSSAPSNDIAVGINLGNGGFQLTHYELDTDADYIIRQHATVGVGDMDADGKLDLVFSGEKSSGPPNQQVAVFRNIGNGQFTRARKFSTDFAAYRVAVHDVTSDGNPDIMIAQAGSSSISRHFSSLTSTYFQLPSNFKFWNNQPATTTAFVQTIDNNASVTPSLSWYQAGDLNTQIPAPTAVGSYVVKANWAGNASYGPSEATQSFNILRAAPTMTYNVAPSTVYNGQPVVATGNVTGIFGEQLGTPNIRYFLASDTTLSNQLAGPPSDAGQYQVYLNFIASGNYDGANALVPFEITPATPTVSISVTGDGRPANGQPLTASASVTGINGIDLGAAEISYYLASDVSFANPLAGAPVASGQYVAVARYLASGNYGNAQATRSFSIIAAESLVVTTSADQLDANASPDLGGTSLREALRYAEQNPGADTITFAPGLAGQTITLSQGWNGPGDDTTLRVSGDVALQGPGGGVNLAILAGTTRRHFVVENSGSLNAHNLSFTGGNLPGGGGSIFNFGSLSLNNVAFTSNTSPGGGGGAIYNQGAAVISGSTFTSNSAGEGGAIQNVGTLNISTSTFSNNNSNFNGGALRLFGTATIDRSMFNGNTVANEGGALISFGNTTITNSTFASNGRHGVLIWEGTANLDHLTVAYNTDGGLKNVNAAMTLRNSIVAGNASFDLSGALASGSTNNLVNLSAAAAKLDVLASNGGPTQTIALLPGSPAINGGVAISGITTDQRGTARPQGTLPDIGAYERIATNALLQSSSYEFETRQAVNFNFDADASVTFGRSSISIQNLTTGMPVGGEIGSLSFDATGQAATLLLTNALPDGRYRATAGATSLDFTVFAGDANRDEIVNISDFAVLAARFNQAGTFSQGDFNYDGVTNIGDFSILASKFNQSLQPAARGFATTSSIERVRSVFSDAKFDDGLLS